ncbi:MAG: hypothetical protein HYZ01_05770 [Ignavibacteriales bacterium]|nr:hypothetical protein [Ignavibacteriales bacterium]
MGLHRDFKEFIVSLNTHKVKYLVVGGYAVAFHGYPGTFIQIGVPPVRIDILNSLPGVIFEECHRKRRKKRIDGIEISFIDLESLMKNKAAVGRKRDLADIEDLGVRKKK